MNNLNLKQHNLLITIIMKKLRTVYSKVRTIASKINAKLGVLGKAAGSAMRN